MRFCRLLFSCGLLLGTLGASAADAQVAIGELSGPGNQAETVRSRLAARLQSDGFEVVLGSAGDRVPVKEVVLTLPAPEASPLLEPLSGDAGRRLASLRYNPLAVVPLVASDRGTLRQVGTGFKVTEEDDYATRGVTAHEALFDRRGLFTAFLGGMGREAVCDRDVPIVTRRGDGDAVRSVEIRGMEPDVDRLFFYHLAAVEAHQRDDIR